jgi:signal transduction histidine kinase
MPNDTTAQIKESELLDLLDKTRALDATYKLTDLVLESFEFDALAKNIADIIPRAMGYSLGILFIIDIAKGKLIKAAISDSHTDIASMTALGAPDKDLSIPLGYEDNLTVGVVNAKKQIVSESLYDFLRPVVTWQEAKVIQNMLGAKGCIGTPLVSRGKAIGALVVCLSKDIEQISEFEKLMLKKFSENAGIAVDNSRLYSNLKLAKDDLHKAYENLKVLNKLKDEFLSVASHELRTPMTIVKSYLWMLQKQKAGKLNKEQERYLEKALEGTQRMIALINDMLDISRFEQKKVTFDLRQIDLCEAIKDSLAGFEIEANKKGIYLKLPQDCKDIFVDADEIKLRDVLVNLVGNAIKFTKEGGVEVGVEDEDQQIKVWIKDTGSGIDPQDLEKLFHKFARIDNSYTIASDAGGTGLGLYIVKLYIEGMSGRVGVWSEGANKGSTFWFTLPKNQIKKYDTSLLKQVDIPVQDTISV